MSRSNPHDHAPNPAKRWFEWNGEQGTVRYYDKDTKKNVDVPLPFTFLLLDELASVRGWHDESKSGIYSNEVRDTRKETFLVKSFKAGTLAEGIYRDIKDRVNSLGAQFVANCYLAFKQDGVLEIGSLRFKGAALGAWMEFRKAHRGDLYNAAINIVGYTEGKKGLVVFRVPTFESKAVSKETNDIAAGLDKELQAWLTGYFSRRTTEQATEAHDDAPVDAEFPSDHGAPLTDDDIPFAWFLPLLLAGSVAAHSLLV